MLPEEQAPRSWTLASPLSMTVSAFSLPCQRPASCKALTWLATCAGPGFQIMHLHFQTLHERMPESPLLCNLAVLRLQCSIPEQQLLHYLVQQVPALLAV